MRKRSRSVGAYAPRPQTVHQSVDEFLDSELTDGIHTIRSGGLIADVLYEDRGGNALLVFFSSIATEKTTWPYFTGLGIAQKLDTSILAFSDPSISLGAPTGWYLGDRRSSYHTEVPRIIEAVAGGRRVVLAGSSGGGFPALHYGASLPGSVTVTVNPRTHLFTPPTPVQHWAKTLYGTDDPQQIKQIVPLKPDRPENKVVYLQNSGDPRYFAAHMIPYLLRLQPEAEVFTLVDHWGDGHVGAPGWLLRRVIGSLLQDPGSESGLVRFDDVETVMEHQADLNLSQNRK